QVLDAEEAERPEYRDEDVTGHLEGRAEHVHDQHLAEPDEAHPPVPRIEQHGGVPEKSLERATMPPDSLAGQYAETLGRFCPTHRFRDELNRVIALTLEHQSMDLDDDFEVLGQDALTVSACFDGHAAAEDPEGARYDGERVETAQREAGQQERANVLDDLKAQQPRAWETNIHEPHRPDAAPIGNADRAADHHDARRLVDEGLHRTQERIRFEQPIGTNTAPELAASNAD